MIWYYIIFKSDTSEYCAQSLYNNTKRAHQLLDSEREREREILFYMWLWLLFSFIFLLVISKKWLRMRVCWNMEWRGMRIMGKLVAATRGDLGTQLRWRPCLVLEKLSSMSLAFTLVTIYMYYLHLLFILIAFFFSFPFHSNST